MSVQPATLAAALLVSAALNDRQPELVVHPRVKDFGVVEQGEVLRAHFNLVNRFAEPVEIKSLLSSCGCSDLKVSSKHISPGTEAVLEATFKTRNARGKKRVSIVIEFTLSDGALRRQLVPMEASIRPEIEVDPPELAFSRDRAQRKIVSFHQWRDGQLVLLDAVCASPAFVAKVLPGQNKVEVVFYPDRWVDDDEGVVTLVVATSNEIAPRIGIPVRITSGTDGAVPPDGSPL